MHSAAPTRVLTCVLTALAFCAALGASPLHAQQTAAPVATFLTKSIGLDAAQLAAVERGDIVVRTLETGNARDVAVFGIVTLGASRDVYARALRDFRSSLRTPTRQHFGLFGPSPTAADLAALTIDRREAEDLKKCKPGSCDFKLPATEMQELRSTIDWSKAPETQIAAYARRRLAEYVAAYRARGDSAMVVYDDNGNVRASSAFASLLAQSPYVYQYAPSLASYLASYPRVKSEAMHEAIYWSEDVAPRLRKVHSVNHVVLYAPPELPGVTLVATKQLYADHYFEAAFDLTTLIDRAGQGAPGGSYLIVLRRFRFDNLPSGGLLNIRGRVIGSLQDQLRGDLERHRVAARVTTQ